MKKWLLYGVLVASVAALTLAACAPAVAPPPRPVGAPAAITPAPASRPAAALTPEDAAWQKVVEAAKKEGKLNAYSFHMVGEPGQAVTRAFKEKYGIHIESITGPGMVLMERIKSERGAGQKVADVYTTAASVLNVAKKEGLLQPLGALPVFKEKEAWVLDPQAVDPDGYIASIYISKYTAIVNTQLVRKEDYPKSYRDLLAPRWKGKIVVGDPDTIPYLTPLYWIMTDRGILDKEYFRQLGGQGLKVVPTARDVVSLVARGESLLAVPAADSTAAPLAAEGAPIQAIPLDEGLLAGGPGGMAMVSEPAHPNAARLFMNWLLSAEGQKVYAEAAKAPSLRKDIPDYSPPAVRVQAKRVLPMTARDEVETARIMRERELSKLMGR